MAKPILPSLLRDLPQYGNKRPFAGDVPQYSGPSQPAEPMTPPSVESQMLRAAENMKMPTPIMGTGGMPGAKSAGVVESQPPLDPNELPARDTPRFQSGPTKLPGLVSNVAATEAVHQGIDAAATAPAVTSPAATTAAYSGAQIPADAAFGTPATFPGAKQAEKPNPLWSEPSGPTNEYGAPELPQRTTGRWQQPVGQAAQTAGTMMAVNQAMPAATTAAPAAAATTYAQVPADAAFGINGGIASEPGIMESLSAAWNQPGLLNGAEMGASNVIPVVAGTVGLGDLALNRESSDIKATLQGGASGAALGWGLGGPYGAAIGAPVGAVYGFLTSQFGSGKDKDQKQRDATRAGLQGAGILDQDYNFTLANGQKWNAGADGSEPIYQVQHPERPITGRVIGAAQVIASIMTGHPNQKDTTDLTGILTNMALSNSDSYEQAMENLMYQFSIYAEKYGITPDQSRAMMKEWKDQGIIDQQTYDAFYNAHESLIDGRDWQYDDNTANQPMEGQATPPQPSTQLDLTKYLSQQQGGTPAKLRELPNAAPVPGATAPVKVGPGEKFPNAPQPNPAPKPVAPAAPARNMRPKVTDMSQLLAFRGAK